jgi:hypothetical protein
VFQYTARGQYGGKNGDETVVAYRDEANVKPDSNTETFALPYSISRPGDGKAYLSIYAPEKISHKKPRPLQLSLNPLLHIAFRKRHPAIGDPIVGI